MPRAAAATKLRPAVGWDRGETGLAPATACSISATSWAVRATGPSTWSVSHVQSAGYVGTSPTDGLRPTTPQNDAGIRSDPPRSVPSASAIIPVTRPAAPPPVEPPALRVGSHGLRVRPNTSLKVFPPRSEEHTSE